MSRLHDGNWKAAVMQYFMSLLLSLGLSLCALKALLPEAALWPAALMCAGITLVFQGLSLIKIKRKWLIPLLFLLALAVWGALGGGPVHTAIQLVKAAFLTLRGLPDAAAPYADSARISVCLLFSLLGAALAWDRTLPLAVFSVVTVVALLFIFNAREELLLCALPAAGGLLLMMVDENHPRLAALPLALLLTALPFLLLPAQGKTVPSLENAATQVRHFVEDYLLFNEYRSSFSLTTEGFQPLEDRLGGPAAPENHTVMEVTTDRTVLLRGRTYNLYNGLSWLDTLSSRRYLYASPRFTSLRDDLLDLNRPAENGVSPQTLRVHMLNDGTTTLFAPAHSRTLQLDGERMVLYYNQAGELFLTRDLKQGDDYTLTYLPYAPGSIVTERLVSEAAQAEDPHYTEVAENYLKLPSHIQKEIFDVAARAIGNAQTPYQKAMNIQNYLRSNYGYNLNVQTPPEAVDFAAWFLIGEKEGYCTYFATAMTVLCRIAGVPARYVTGYLAVPDENGTALVTGRQAHAWTEVYLNGFGWLDFDATPRSDNERSGEGSADSAPDQTPPPATPTPPPQEETPTPSPEPEEQPSETPPSPEPEAEQPETSPSPEPSQAPQDDPSDEASEDEEEDDRPTPTPPQNGPTDMPDSRQGDRISSSFPWWIILLILALLALIIARCLLTEPLRRAGRKPDQATEILFAAVSALLARKGISRRSTETLHEFAVRADEALAEQGDLSIAPLADSLAAQVYGRHPAKPDIFQDAYCALRRQASLWTRFRLAFRRFFTFGKQKS